MGRGPLLLAVVLAGCGGSGEERPAAEPATKPVGKEITGSVVQFADCRDWRRGSPEARVATVKALRGQLTAQTSRTATSPLPDARAYEIFEKACSPSYAGSLRLYKLYVRAQAFAPLG